MRWALLGGACAGVVAMASACGGSDGGDDEAARLVRNQTSGSCDAPPLAPATLTPLGLNPLGIATLTAQPKPGAKEGEASKQESDEVLAAARNFVNCWNQRRFESAVALTTEDYLKAHFVLKNSADILVVLAGAPDIPYTVKKLGDAQRHGDGRVSVAVEYLWVHQEVNARWYFVKEDGRWYFDQEDRGPVETAGTNAVVNIEMTEFAYKIEPAVIKKSDTVTMKVKNVGGLPHEVFLVTLAQNIDATKLFQPGVKPEGVTFFGHVVEMAGNEGEVVMKGLEPGLYIMVCQFRFPGAPIVTHSQSGMIGAFTVE